MKQMGINVCTQQNHTAFKTISQNSEVIGCHQALHTNYLIFTFSQGGTNPRRHWWHNSHTLPLVSPYSLLSQILQKKLQVRPLHGIFYCKHEELLKKDAHAHYFSVLKFYFICRTIICYWSILFSQTPACMKWKPVHLLPQLLFYHDPANLSAVQPILSPVCWQFPGMFSLCCTGQTGIWHPNSLKALFLGLGLGSTQVPNKPTHKYLHRTGCTSGWDSK